MREQRVCSDTVWIASPCERPDVPLARAAAKAGAFPVLHLGRNEQVARKAVDELSSTVDVFGVCVADGTGWAITLPSAVSTIILPWGMTPPPGSDAEIVWQIRTPEEAMEALETAPEALVIKGCESAGVVGDDSAFILFQELLPLCLDAGVSLRVQGGVGVHTASAYMALGAAGVVLDSQMALFPECSLPQDTKNTLKRLTGSEIRQCDHFNYYLPAQSGDEPGTIGSLMAAIAQPGSPILALGQDVILSADLVDEHKRVSRLVRVLNRCVVTHMNQARISDPFASTSPAAKRLGTKCPITQGPMARISDVPQFLDDIAQSGALPFLAMGLEEGQTTREMLAGAAKVVDGRPWGAGILGFAPPSVLAEQTAEILRAGPSYVLIAGARPGQDKVFEQAGIKVLMHAATPGVLDLLIKSGASSFIFEGRESGGHVGPLVSCVLWEKQINTILSTGDPSEFLVLFAGGIHDALSAAFVRIMASPLSARGVGVGLQCGTAYLYTTEAVDSGAITAAYQELLLENNKTYLLKSASGQETRCIRSPFTQMFEQEKARMTNEGLPPSEIQNKLELLNLGRLRVASKGVGHADGTIVALSPAQQHEQGLYMTGAVTQLMAATTSIADLHTGLIEDSWQMVSAIDLPDVAPAPTHQSDIAIIGMAGVFPGADTVEEFWRNIVFGNDCITQVSPDRWDPDVFFDPNSHDTEHTISKWGGFIGTSDFDALEFGMPPESVSHIEPQQLLALLVAKRALQDAGLTDPANPDFEETSVFFGVEGAGELIKTRNIRTVLREIMGELPPDLDRLLPRLTEYEFPGFLTNVTAGRISNRLNTCGRNYAVDAACAASLAALDIAITELRDNKAEMAIVGGADLHNRIDDYLGFNSIGALSPKGHCATFDADADGLAISEGVCAVILKRLEDAERDGNTIYAVIRGIGGSSDGRSLGLTAPSKRGQLLSLERAYENAGVRPRDVGLIEAHGTGTALGDWTEVGALTQFFLEDGVHPGQVSLGSLKSVIGHTKTAAGVAGLIKAALCVYSGILPPTLHVHHLNKAFGPGTPFALRTDKPGHWHGNHRVAGVSAFGFGGTNFHVILENHRAETPLVPLTSWPSELFVFPGSTPQEAEALMDKVSETLALNDKSRLIDISYSLSLRCIAKTAQYVIVAGTREELLTRMKRAKQGMFDENTYRLHPVEGKVAFLFPGQGGQRVNMAADLFTVFPRMRAVLNDHPDLEDVLFPPSVFTAQDKKRQRLGITDTRNAQPIMGIVDVAMAALLNDFGITPDVVAGHSYGELPALCYAGVIEQKDLVSLSRTRAEAIVASIKDDKGRMAAVFADKETLSDLLTGLTGVWPVNYNAPQQIVVAGTSPGVEAFLQKAEKVGVTCQELNTDCAFHSPLVRGADARFSAALKDYALHAPRVEVMSNIDSGVYPPDEAAIKQRLAKHLVNPVFFAEEITSMADQGVTVFIEAGPGGSLTQLVTNTVNDAQCIRTEDGNVNGLTYFLQGMAKYIATGRAIKMSELFKGRGAAALYLEDPQTLKKTGVVFNVNAQYALAEGAEPPAFKQQVSAWFDNALSRGGSGPVGGDPGTEQVMLSYMNNMAGLISNMGGLIENMGGLVHDQRDAVLGYLGVYEDSPRPAPMVGAAESQADDPPVDDPPASVEPMSTPQITDLIFDVVSEKTGYPTSMLSLDTDLEADLSIDSIKKMEIVSELGHRLNLPAGSEGMETSFDTIISIKTFRDLAAWIEMVANAGADTGTRTTEQETRDNAPTGLTRIIVREHPCPLTGTNPRSITGANFALTDDGAGLASQVARRLISMGAQATIVDADTDLGGVDGLILINSSAGREYSVLDLFTLVKRADMDRLNWVLTADDSFGACVRDTDPHRTLPGFPGFLKTLQLEYPGKRMCAVSCQTVFDPRTFPAIVTDELTAVHPRTDVVYRGGDRLIRRGERVGLDTSTEPRKLLDRDSVVLVLGGAGGIAPHVVRRLAEDAPYLYVLVGRSEDDPVSEAYDHCATLEDVQTVLTHEGMDNPKAINAAARRIVKSKQITNAISLIEETGATAVYQSTDVTDPQSFAALIDSVTRQYGPIDAVIHAAGTLEDKLFRDKQLESFSRVYAAKTAPLGILAQKLVPDLKLMAFFSSVVADVGNAGQCDYAAANSVLDDTARLWGQLYPGMRVVAFNWGPWRGAGMVSAAFEKQAGQKGMGFIDLDVGADFFAAEVAYGSEPVVTALNASEAVVTSFAETGDE